MEAAARRKESSVSSGQSRRRRIGAATFLGLTALLMALVVGPSVGQAASTGIPVAEMGGRQVLAVDNAAPTLTLREVKKMAERAAGTSLRASELSVLVDGGGRFPALLLVGLVDGPGLDLTLREVTGGQSEAVIEIKVIIVKGDCNDCTFN
jgi:hypothetical protein